MYKTSPTCQIATLPQIYQSVFGDDHIGTFVEIGAYDGLTYSNTYGLAEMGWRGLYVEAVPEYCGSCRHNHADYENIDVVCACVGSGEDATLYIAGEYTTTSQEFIDLVPAGWHITYSGGEMVQTITLDRLLDKHWHEHKETDLFVIDVEGGEMAVLNGLTMDYWRPKMVIIEACERHPKPDRRINAPGINAYFRHAGYNKIYSDDCNNIYTRA
jgi:FkbM family methyltransferase